MEPMDFGTPFAFLFRHPRRLQVLFAGAGLLLISPLIVPFLMVLGYGVELGRFIAEGNEDLPRFRLGQAADGLRAIVILIGYLVPMFLLMALGLLLVGLSGETPDAPAIAVMILGYLVVFLYGFAITALQPAIFAVFIAERSIAACFRPRLLQTVIAAQGWSYLAVAALLVGVSQLTGAGIILFLVGILFTSFNYLVVYAHFAGQLARPLMPRVTPLLQSP
jgi:hypothetical protein